MDDIAWPATEDRVELVLTREREALIAARLVAGESVTEVPAPRTLCDVAGNRSDVANLRRRDTARGFGEHRVLLLDCRMLADVVERGFATDGQATGCRRNLVRVAQATQADDHIWFDDAFLDEAEQ